MSAAFDHAPVAALIVDMEGCIESANLAACCLLRLSFEDLKGKKFAEVVPSGDRVLVEHPNGSSAASLWVGAFADGSAVVQLVEASSTAPSGATLEEQRAFRSALLELSELSHAHDDDADFYQTLLLRAVSVVPGAQAGSIVLKRPGTDEYYFVAAHGFDLAALQERCLYESEIMTDAVTAEAMISRDLAEWSSSPEQAEWLATAGRIHEIVVNVSAPVFVAGAPVAFISLDNFDDPDAFSTTSVEMTTVIGRLIADLLRRRELEAQVRRERESYKHLAHHDGLTDLANRRSIEFALSEFGTGAASEGVPLAVLFVDVDDFKGVNDRFGHEIGDEVLVAVADALRRATRPADIVGRWGGDEFMVIAPGVVRQADVLALAERVLGLLDDDVVLADGRTVPCRLSIGAAWRASGAVETGALVRRADEALYEAKHAGKHTVRIALV